MRRRSYERTPRSIKQPPRLDGEQTLANLAVMRDALAARAEAQKREDASRMPRRVIEAVLSVGQVGRLALVLMAKHAPNQVA